MAEQLVKGAVYMAVLGGVGYTLMKVFTPSEDKMREKLGVKKDSSASKDSRQRTSDIMAALKKEAGIDETDTKKKR